MSEITWVHLSDIHYWETGTGWDSNRIQSTLVQDLHKMEQVHGLRPDMLFITGDTVQGHVNNSPGNNIADQFKGVLGFIDNVRNVFNKPITKNNTFIVPGNHDVNRTFITELQTYFLDNVVDENKITDSIRTADKSWDDYMLRLRDYRENLLRSGGYLHLLSDENRLIYSIVREFGIYKVGISGFNSAWSCGRADEEGKLWLGGRWQAATLLKELGDVDLSIALIHHPGRWFNRMERDTIDQILTRDFHLSLHGHEHIGWIKQDAGTGHVRIAAAATYQGSTSHNGYNFVRLDLETGKIQVWLRMYEPEGAGWVPRVISGQSNNDGLVECKNSVTQTNSLEVRASISSAASSSAWSAQIVQKPAIENDAEHLSNVSEHGFTQDDAVAHSNDSVQWIGVKSTIPSEIHLAKAQARIEVVSRMLDTCRSEAAKSELVAIRAETWSFLSAEMRSKVANNEGVAAMQLDDFDAAHRYFKEALGWDPSSPKIMANIASVSLSLGQALDALQYSERALSIDPLNESATAVLLQALDAAGDSVRLDSILGDPTNAWICESSSICAAALASISLKHNNYKDARRLTNNAIGGHSVISGIESAQLHMLLGFIILRETIDDVLAAGRSIWEMSLEQRQQLFEAERAYTAALNAASNCENPTWRIAALVNRAAVRRLLQRSDEALHDLSSAVAISPTDKIALENRAILLLELDRPEQAVADAELAMESKGCPSGQFIKGDGAGLEMYTGEQLLCQAYLNAGFHQKVWDRLKSQQLENNDYWKAAMLLQASLIVNDDNASTAVSASVEYLTSIQDGNGRPRYLLSVYYEHIGQLSLAITHIRQARDECAGPECRQYALVLGRLLYVSGSYDEAAEVFSEAVSIERNDEYLPEFTVCLYYSNRLAEALEAARAVRRRGGATLGVTEIEASILERGGDLDGAIEALEALCQTFPRDYAHKVHLAHVQRRANRREPARIILEKIPFTSVSSRGDLLIQIAALRQALDMDEVLRFAYQARRLSYSDAEVHAVYMNICMHMDFTSDESRSALQGRELVGVDDAVTLDKKGQRITLIIESDGVVHADRGEINLNDIKAQVLLGSHLGDVLELPTPHFVTTTYTIVDIKSKYLHASHESAALFQSHKLEHPSLGVFDTEDADFKDQFWRFITRISENDTDIVELYRNGTLSLTSFAIILGRPLLDVWVSMLSWENARLLSFGGSQEDMELQVEHLGADGLISSLDFISLLTIVHSGLQDYLATRASRLLVARPILDDLLKYEFNLMRSGELVGTFGVVNGERFFLETPTDELLKRRKLVSDVIQFVTDHTEVVSAMALNDADTRHLEMFGASQLAAILVAREHNAILYCDDLKLRLFAQQEYTLRGIDSQGIIKDLCKRKIITNDFQNSALGRLAESRYHFVSVNSDIIISLLELHSFRQDPPVQALFATLEGPDCTEVGALSVTADVIKRIWLRQIFQHHKTSVLDAALRALVKGRNQDEMIGQLLVILAQAFRLAPTLQRDVAINIALWLRSTRIT